MVEASAFVKCHFDACQYGDGKMSTEHFKCFKTDVLASYQISVVNYIHFQYSGSD